MLDFLLGSVKENAEREYANYDFETGTRKKDFGDILGDLLTGRGKAIDDAVKAEHIKRLENEYGVAREEASSVLGAGSTIPTLTANTDPNKVKQEVQRTAPKVQSFRNALDFAAQNGIQVDPAQFNGNSNQLNTYIQGKIEEKKEAERLKLQGERQAETLRQEGRADKQLAAQMELGRLDRQADREARRDQLALDNRRLDIQEARAARSSRQAAIQQMMAGLAQMGASIAI